MSNRKHDRTDFFKYSSLSTAKKVIRSRSFRWSSPTKFNDPFDHQVGFSLEYDTEVFARLLVDSLDRLIFSDAEPAPVPGSKLNAAALMFREGRESLDRDEVLNELYEGSRELAAELASNINELSAEIHELLCHSRVLCVSELHDNIVMWSHYADQHRGVVFKLRCIEEIDDDLIVARKVDYTDKLIALGTAEEYAKHLTGEDTIEMEVLCWNMAFTKHLDWSYEKEWRVHAALLDEPIGSGYNLYSKDPMVFEAIYLGCRMKDSEVDEIVELVNRFLPDTKVYRGEKSKTAFALSFAEIT